MKKIIGLGGLSIAAMTLLISVFAGQKNEIKVAQGYSTSSLPTTIDLNDTTLENILSHSQYGQGLSNFITDRDVSTAKPNVLPILFVSNNENTITIIVVCIISVSSVGLYFFIKSRRKEEF